MPDACRAGATEPAGSRKPYGGYCNGPRWGWYGARCEVKTVDDARKALEEYFAGTEMKIGAISHRGRFFEAEVLDRNNVVTDRVIVDRRTGRIRSIY